MQMPTHAVRLLALLGAFSISPAVAGNPIGGATDARHHVDCPYERARLEALAWTKDEPMTIRLIEPVPAESALSGASRISGLLTP